jgi:hypothetical protein
VRIIGDMNGTRTNPLVHVLSALRAGHHTTAGHAVPHPRGVLAGGSGVVDADLGRVRSELSAIADHSSPSTGRGSPRI